MARATAAAAAATDLSFSVDDLLFGDAVLYKIEWKRPWRAGEVVGLSPHSVRVKDTQTGIVMTIHLGKKGKVKRPTGGELAELVATIRAATARNAVASPEGLRYYLGSQPPRAPYRDADYLVFVRTWPCIGCGQSAPCEAHHAGGHGVGVKADDYSCVPLCRSCHDDVTTHYTVPGRWTRDEYEARQLRAQVALLSEWAQREAVQR